MCYYFIDPKRYVKKHSSEESVFNNSKYKDVFVLFKENMEEMKLKYYLGQQRFTKDYQIYRTSLLEASYGKIQSKIFMS